MRMTMRWRLVLAIAAICGCAGNVEARTIYHVDHDAPPGGDGLGWSSAFDSLTDAIDAAIEGDEIRVAGGVYTPARPGGRRDVSFRITKPITLRGGFAGLSEPDGDRQDFERFETVLSGDLNGDDGPACANRGDNSFQILEVDHYDPVVIEGFTITGGQADGDKGTHDTGAALIVHWHNEVDVRFCRFRGNFAIGAAAISAEPSEVQLRVSNSIFSGNHGSSILETKAETELLGCVIQDNRGTAVRAWGSPDDVVMVNCTIVANVSDAPPAGLYVYGRRVHATNCIVWGNVSELGDGLESQVSVSRTTMDYSCVQNWSPLLPGIGSFGDDPSFLRLGGPDNPSDLHLMPNSPCLDTGDAYALPDDIFTDPNGVPRFIDQPFVSDTGRGAVKYLDLGAFENTADCNGNGLLDDQEMHDGHVTDCNDNGLPDTCEGDCNANGTFDPCDLEYDCNENAVPDECDIAKGTSVDCQPNGVPDECELLSGAALDCNDNEVPDECELALDDELDCNSNGVLDECEGGCNDNRSPDACDIASGRSNDCNGNGIPDECETDCNRNGLADVCDIESGLSADGNGDGTPDECVVLHVDARAKGVADGSSWSDAYVTLSEAVAAAATAEQEFVEVRIAQGSYSETVELPRGMALRGGFAGLDAAEPDRRHLIEHPTVLDGDIAENDVPVDCCWTHGTPGCQDPICEQLVCEEDPSCCTGEWHYGCTLEAWELCANICGLRDDNLRELLTARSIDDELILDGLTLTGANRQGLWCFRCTSLKIIRSRFLNNGVVDEGGAVLLDSEVSIKDCWFADNTGHQGSALYAHRGAIHLEQTGFHRNRSSGGAVVTEYSLLLARGVIFRHNAGGGLKSHHNQRLMVVDSVFERNAISCERYYYCRGGGAYIEGAPADFINCRFIGNSANSGGALAIRGAARLQNTIVVGNRAKSRAAIELTDHGRIELDYSTVHANVAEETVGGIGWDGRGSGGVDIRNSVVWGNRDADGTLLRSQLDVSHIFSVENACVQGGSLLPVGSNVFDADPVFADPLGADGLAGTRDDDLRLVPESPLINQGDIFALDIDYLDLDGDGDTKEFMPIDLDGNPRVAGYYPDPGALESVQSFIVREEPADAPEGDRTQIRFLLVRDPGQEIAITGEKVHGDADLHTSRNPFTIRRDSTNYFREALVTVDADEDDDFLNGEATFRFSAPGLVPVYVTVREVDNDAPPNVLLVDAAATGTEGGVSWENAFTDLQQAIDLARRFEGVEEIWVAEGVYRPDQQPGDREATFHVPGGFAIYGGFAGGETQRDQRDPQIYRSVLSGDLLGDDAEYQRNRDDNVYSVVTVTDDDVPAIIDGFTISGGNAIREATDLGRGGGIHNTGNLVLRNSVVTGNIARQEGGGAYVRHGRLDAADCVFRANDARDGGGIRVYSPGVVTARRTAFMGNRASEEGGGIMAIFSLAELELVNSVFLGNTAGVGGGAVRAWYGQVAVLNSTIASNFAPVGAGISFTSTGEADAPAIIGNSIIWGNEPSGISVQISEVNFHHSCVQGWDGNLPGVGSTGLDPGFRDLVGADGVGGTGDEDLRLTPASPCVDAGDNGLVPDDAAGDFNGYRRFVDAPLSPDTGAGEAPIVDMGAFELLPGDAVADGWIDLADYSAWEKCMTGPGGRALPAGGGEVQSGGELVDPCVDLDVDGDGDVDLVDFGGQQILFGR